MIQSIREAGDIEGKRVLVRVDWNVSIEEGAVTDDFRIKQSLPTLEFLKEAGAEVMLATHLDPDEASVEPLLEYVPEGMSLLPNLRNNPGEKSNSEEFARELAAEADIYVNEAFSASHREHASIVGVPKLLPSYAGFQFLREKEELENFFNPSHPLVVILGGAKFETKIPLIEKFLLLADCIFVGGALAHNFWKEEGRDIRKSLVSDGEFHTKILRESGKIILPEDPVWVGERIVDAGPKTIENLKLKIENSSSVLWNGPLGLYEEGYKEGTLSLARILGEHGEKVVVGGGDTLAALKELNISDKFKFVSTAGGAMLDFLAKGTLPGIKALERS